MTATQRDTSFPSCWSKTTKLRQERIARRLAENGSRANKIDLEAIRARRARLKELTKSMKRPMMECHSASSSSAYSKKNIRLAPIGPRSPNQLDWKKQKDTLLQKRKLSSMSPTPSVSLQSEDGLRELCDVSDAEEEIEKKYGVGEQQKKERIKDEKEENKNEEYNMAKLQIKRSDENINKKKMNDEKVKSIIKKIKSVNEEECLKGIKSARKHLSNQDFPLSDIYIDGNAIYPLVSCLSSNDSNLQFEAAGVLTSLVSEMSEYAKAVYEAGAISKLIALLNSPDERVATQAVSAIGNLANDSLFMCQNVIDEGALEALYNLAEKSSSSLDCLRKLAKTFRIINGHKSLSLSRQDIIVLIKAAKIFIHHYDAEIYLNGCWSFTDITESDRTKIDEVLKANVVPYIIEEYLNSNDEKKIMPAVKTVGNIMAETDDQTEAIVAAGVIPVLVRQLDHESRKIRQDCSWALSNIMGGTRSQIQKVIDANALPRLAAIINDDEPSVRKEAIWCVSNMTEIGSPSQIREAIKNDLLRSFVKNIRRYTTYFDKPLLYNILNGIRNMIKFCSDETAVNIILQEISIESIEELTVCEDNDISEVSKLLYYFLCYDEEGDEQEQEQKQEQSVQEQEQKQNLEQEQQEQKLKQEQQGQKQKVQGREQEQKLEEEREQEQQEQKLEQKQGHSEGQLKQEQQEQGNKPEQQEPKLEHVQSHNEEQEQKLKQEQEPKLGQIQDNGEEQKQDKEQQDKEQQEQEQEQMENNTQYKREQKQQQEQGQPDEQPQRQLQDHQEQEQKQKECEQHHFEQEQYEKQQKQEQEEFEQGQQHIKHKKKEHFEYGPEQKERQEQEQNLPELQQQQKLPELQQQQPQKMQEAKEHREQQQEQQNQEKKKRTKTMKKNQEGQ